MAENKVVSVHRDALAVRRPDSGPGESANDKLYANKRATVEDFRFGAETAAVFDDMVSRSVPFYGEIQRMASELAADFAVPDTSLFDLGCATGTTLMALDQMVDESVRFVAIDNSDEMLLKARLKMAKAAERRRLEFINADLNSFVQFDDASVVMLMLTLQFVRPLYRERLVRRIHGSLRDGGAVILVEKITGSHSLLNRLFIEHYYGYKRRAGYSEMEIAQKREALENVLIPYRFDENREMLLDIGFRHVEEFFRWYNFCGVIAVK